jgi:hypothetical protein
MYITLMFLVNIIHRYNSSVDLAVMLYHHFKLCVDKIQISARRLFCTGKGTSSTNVQQPFPLVFNATIKQGVYSSPISEYPEGWMYMNLLYICMGLQKNK